MCSAALLSPALRLIPRLPTVLAGRAAWLSAVAAAPVLLLDLWFLTAFLSKRRSGEGMYELICRALGEKLGRAVLAILALWFVLYCGFIFRSGADKFISTIYPSGAVWVFVGVMFVIGLIASLGPVKTLVRTAKVLWPVILAVFMLVLVLALSSCDFKLLVPVTAQDAVPVLKGAVPFINVVGVVLTFSCFLEGGTPKIHKRFRPYAFWIIPALLFLGALCAVTIGNYGHMLTGRLSYSFFTLVWDVKLFSSLERIEVLVVTLWVLPDFLYTSMLLIIGSRGLMKAVGYVSRGDTLLFDMKNGRWLIPACAVAACVVGLVIPGGPVMKTLSETWVPVINMCLIFGLLPLCFAVGKIRKVI